MQSRKNCRSEWITIKGIEPAGEITGRCIAVAHGAHQFLAGTELIPTGNSQLSQHNVELNAKLANRGIRLAPHVTTGHNKWDPQFGVEAMAPLFYNQMISIPYASIGDRSRVRPWEEQLLAFPMGKVTDLVMATWFAELGIKEMVTRTTLPLFDPRFRAPKRIMRQRRLIDFGDRTVVGVPSNGYMVGGRAIFPPAPGSDRQMVNVQPPGEPAA